MKKRRKRKSYKNEYWPRETDQYITLFNQTEDEAERNRIFEEHLYKPFKEMAKAIVAVHSWSDNIQMDSETLIDDIVGHGVKALPLYKEGKKSFPYFNVVLRNRLYQLNIEKTEYCKTTHSIELFLKEDEDIGENPLFGEEKIPQEFTDEYLAELREYWRKYFYIHFPKEYAAHEAAKFIIELLFARNWYDENLMSRPKHGLYHQLRSEYRQKFGHELNKFHLFKTMSAFRAVNQRQYKNYLNHRPLTPC